MRWVFASWGLALIVCVGACDGDGSDGVNPGADLSFGEFCDTAFPQQCPTNICRDVVSGQATKGNTSYDFDRASIEGTICTRSCDSDSDCSGMSFASTNGYSVATESWSCSSVCVVRLTAPASTADACSRCLDACRGLTGCCTGSGCLCEKECN